MNISRRLQIAFLIAFFIGFASGDFFTDIRNDIGKIIGAVGGGVGDVIQGNISGGIKTAIQGFNSAFVPKGIEKAIKNVVNDFKDGGDNNGGKDSGGNDSGGMDSGGNDNGGNDNGGNTNGGNDNGVFKDKVTNYANEKGNDSQGNDTQVEDKGTFDNSSNKDVKELIDGLIKSIGTAVKNIVGQLKDGQFPNISTDVDSGIDSFFNDIDSSEKKAAGDIIVNALMTLIKVNGKYQNKDPIVALADTAKKIKNGQPILPGSSPLVDAINKLIETFGTDIVKIAFHLVKKAEDARGKNTLIDFATNLIQPNNLIQEGAAVLPLVL